jgi:hypothetical protein
MPVSGDPNLIVSGEGEQKRDDVAHNDHIERAETGATNDEAIFSKFPKMDKVDEFGAHAKTDPREIALVKKLDKYIIVSTWISIAISCS